MKQKSYIISTLLSLFLFSHLAYLGKRQWMVLMVIIWAGLSQYPEMQEILNWLIGLNFLSSIPLTYLYNNGTLQEVKNT